MVSADSCTSRSASLDPQQPVALCRRPSRIARQAGCLKSVQHEPESRPSRLSFAGPQPVIPESNSSELPEFRRQLAAVPDSFSQTDSAALPERSRFRLSRSLGRLRVPVQAHQAATPGTTTLHDSAESAVTATLFGEHPAPLPNPSRQQVLVAQLHDRQRSAKAESTGPARSCHHFSRALCLTRSSLRELQHSVAPQAPPRLWTLESTISLGWRPRLYAFAAPRLNCSTSQGARRGSVRKTSVLSTAGSDKLLALRMHSVCAEISRST